MLLIINNDLRDKFSLSSEAMAGETELLDELVIENVFSFSAPVDAMVDNGAMYGFAPSRLSMIYTINTALLTYMYIIVQFEIRRYSR